MKSARFPKEGFTLVECLVVVAIVAILAGILIPVIGSVRESARDTACISNLRQYGIAAQLFLTDHKNVMVPHKNDDESARWYDWLRAYMPPVADEGNAKKGPFCPDLEEASFSKNRLGYGWNGNLGRTSGTKMAKLINGAYETSRVVVAWDDLQTQNNVSGGWPTAKAGGGSWYQLAFRHNGACNILLLDGHVASLTAGSKGDAQDFPNYQWGPFPDYPDVPIPAKP